jgi:quercetin dioxygenase-like cupin family protein
MSRTAVISALVGGIAIGAAATVAVGQAQVARNVLGKIDVTGAQANLGSADFPAGGVIARHSHPGEELAYVAEGAVVLSVDGQGDRLAVTGESFLIPRGVVHSARAAGGPAKIVAVWIVDKGQPLAQPAP